MRVLTRLNSKGIADFSFKKFSVNLIKLFLHSETPLLELYCDMFNKNVNEFLMMYATEKFELKLQINGT